MPHPFIRLSIIVFAISTQPVLGTPVSRPGTGFTEQRTTASEGCTAYNPVRVIKRKLQNQEWLVSDGGAFSQRVLGEDNADKVIALARSYGRRCRIPGTAGRYIDYWEPDTPSSTLGPIGQAEDCLDYVSSELRVVAMDGQYRVGAGKNALATFSTPANADKMLRIAKRHTRRCFIGRELSSATPNRRDLIVGYWR